MHRKAVSLALLLGCLVAAPAFAQKSNLPKVVKTVTESSVQKNVKTLIQPKVMRAWRTQALKEAKHVDILFKNLFAKVNLASNTHQLLDIASFRMYNEQYGLIPALDKFWLELLEDISIVYGGPAKFVETTHSVIPHKITLSPAETQKRLLQKEARLKHAAKRWKELKSFIQKTIPAENYAAYSQRNAITQFLRNDYAGESEYAKAIFLYTSGKRNIVQTLVSEEYTSARAPIQAAEGAQWNVSSLYNEILAWAHGKGKFPFTVDAVAQMLELDKYAVDGHSALYQNLNTPGCKTLRDWGWTDGDIRQFIKDYKSHATQQYASRSILWDKQNMQRYLKKNWNAFWYPIIQKESAVTRQVLKYVEEGF